MIKVELRKIQLWQLIDMPKRMELRDKYGVNPTAKVEVANNHIVRDGITEGDLADIDKEVLENAVLGVERKSPGQKKVAKKIKKKRYVKKEQDKKASKEEAR